MKRILKILILSIFFSISNSWAQNPYFLTLNKTSGLPSNVVYDAFQDSKGFIWFATAASITRFDGYLRAPFIHERYLSLLKMESLQLVFIVSLPNHLFLDEVPKVILIASN